MQKDITKFTKKQVRTTYLSRPLEPTQNQVLDQVVIFSRNEHNRAHSVV